MITLRQAVELTLSAIEEGVSFDHLDNVTAPMLRRALAEPQDPVAYDGWVLREVLFDNGEPVGHRAPEQEPVAWMDREGDLYKMPEIKNWAPPHTMLYTAPMQRKPLTEEEIKVIEEGIWKSEFFDATERQANREFARAIEAAHGIGEKHERKNFRTCKTV